MSNRDESNHKRNNQETVNQSASTEIEEPVRNYHGQPVPVHVVTSGEKSKMDNTSEDDSDIDEQKYERRRLTDGQV